MNIFEHGVSLPTNGSWVDIPGSPFQVRTFVTDPVGTFQIRVNPQWRERWDRFVDSADWMNPDAVS